MVKRRTATYARIDSLVELLGPGWYAVLGSDYGIAALGFLARYADPHTVIRLGQARLARFLINRSRGAWRDDHAAALVTAAKQTLELWRTSDGSDAMDFAELAADTAHEADQALFLTRQIRQIDERIADLYAEADPQGIVQTAPGVSPVTGAVIAGRLGDPHRFTSLAAIRAYTGLVPITTQSGVGSHTSNLTKAGTHCCAKCCSPLPILPARPIPNSPRNTSDSWPATVTTTQRSVTSPRPWSPGSRPACAANSPTSSAMSMAHQSLPNKDATS